jgi:hypothetical protein
VVAAVAAPLPRDKAVKVVVAAAVPLMFNLSGVDRRWYLVFDILRGDRKKHLTIGV